MEQEEIDGILNILPDDCIGPTIVGRDIITAQGKSEGKFFVENNCFPTSNFPAINWFSKQHQEAHEGGPLPRKKIV
jgi:hypothetical protein